MLIAKLIFMFMLFYNIIENLIKWKQPKKQDVYGGLSYVIAMSLCMVMYYYVGIFEPIGKMLK